MFPFSRKPNIELLKSKNSIKGLVKALGNLHVREEASNALISLGSSAVNDVKPALSHKKAFVREAAARILGYIGDENVITPLLTLLRDPDSVVREAAVEALDKVGGRPAERDDEITYWRIKYKWDKKNAAVALKRLNVSVEEFKVSKKKLKPIKATLTDSSSTSELLKSIKSEDASICEPAIRILGKKTEKRAFKPIVAKLKSEDSKIRDAAARAIGRIGDQRAIKHLIPALQDSSLNVRNTAAKALERLNWESKNNEDIVRYYIARGEWEKCPYYGEEAIKPLFEAALRFGKKIAVETLGKIDDKQVIEPLRRLREFPNLRDFAESTMTKMGHESLSIEKRQKVKQDFIHQEIKELNWLDSDEKYKNRSKSKKKYMAFNIAAKIIKEMHGISSEQLYEILNIKLKRALKLVLKEQFVERAMRYPTVCNVRISKIPIIHEELRKALIVDGKTSNEVSKLMDEHAILICPECHEDYKASAVVGILSTANILGKSRLEFTGKTGGTERLLEELCINPDCNCHDVMYFWRAGKVSDAKFWLWIRGSF